MKFPCSYQTENTYLLNIMGRKLTELTTATNLFPGDLFLVDNQGTSRKATLFDIVSRVLGGNFSGVRRAAKITFGLDGFISGIDNGLLSASQELTYPSISANSAQAVTVSVTGASVGDGVTLGLPTNIPASVVPSAWVSAPNVVSVRLTNITSNAVNPPPGVYTVLVHKL
jgi:hypothetical protein